MFYVITPNTHKWHRITANKIFESNKLVLCDDHITHMAPIPPAEPSDINTFTTITRLTFLQIRDEQVINILTQPMYSDMTLVNQNTNSSLQNQNVHPHYQSDVISQQFSMIAQELRNFTDKVSSDINKITQACKAAQENIGKLTENTFSQALTKPQDILSSDLAIDSRTPGATHASTSSYETN